MCLTLFHWRRSLPIGGSSRVGRWKCVWSQILCSCTKKVSGIHGGNVYTCKLNKLLLGIWSCHFHICKSSFSDFGDENLFRVFCPSMGVGMVAIIMVHLYKRPLQITFLEYAVGNLAWSKKKEEQRRNISCAFGNSVVQLLLGIGSNHLTIWPLWLGFFFFWFVLFLEQENEIWVLEPVINKKAFSRSEDQKTWYFTFQLSKVKEALIQSNTYIATIASCVITALYTAAGIH